MMDCNYTVINLASVGLLKDENVMTELTCIYIDRRLSEIVKRKEKKMKKIVFVHKINVCVKYIGILL